MTLAKCQIKNFSLILLLEKNSANSSLNFKKVVKSAEKATESFVFDYKAEEKNNISKQTDLIKKPETADV
ncbi:MAG: hypothetical protein SOV49_09090, partial [Erysipelotrichaceae bacterium]|nr:hypothetical protein [Erysipelotrichaceae bacterium]